MFDPGTFPALSRAALQPGAQVRILPAGRFLPGDGRPLRAPGWYLDAAIAARLVAAGAPSGSDYLIDYEHQSLNASKNGLPTPAAGWFSSLEWREGDGLYMAGIRWTDTARDMIEAAEYRHVSPVFTFDSDTGAVTRVVSVALTNMPALKGLADLARLSMVPPVPALPAVAPAVPPISSEAQRRIELRQAVDRLGSDRAREAFMNAFGTILGLDP